ncbi:hypothetical protein KP509_31G022700 [Ceratopteris richardii]|nr:hypothetical protein KP509_31G022700 [Ceratopteris richardii]
MRRLCRRISVSHGLYFLPAAEAFLKRNYIPNPEASRHFTVFALKSRAWTPVLVPSLSLHCRRESQEAASLSPDSSVRQDAQKDAETEAAGTALQRHLQNQWKAYLTDARSVVSRAPLFLKRLVEIVKHSNAEGVDDDQKEKRTRLSPPASDEKFEKQALACLKTENINILEPIMESIGMNSDRIDEVLQKLRERNVDIRSFLFVIRRLEKLGLSRETLGDVVEKEIGVLSYQSDEIERGFLALKDLSINEELIISLIMKYPLIFRSKGIENISVLKEELKELPSKDELFSKAIGDNPACIHEYEAGRAENVLIFLKSYGLKDECLDRMLKRHFRLVFLDVEKQLKPAVMFLKGVGMSRRIIGKVIRRSPGFLFYDVEGNLKKRLEYFKSLGFNETEFALIITRFPIFFSYSLENKIKPAVDKLKVLGLSEIGLKKIVLNRPTLFSHKLDGDLSVLITSLKQSEYTEKQKITAFLNLYSRGADHRKKCEECLVKYGLTDAEAKRVLDKEPGILGYNVYCIASRLDHLTKNLGLSVQNVLSAPSYLSFPFKRRILRREKVLTYMKSKGLLTKDLPLVHLLSPSNIQFYKEFVEPHSNNQELSKIWYNKMQYDAEGGGLHFLQDSFSNKSMSALDL